MTGRATVLVVYQHELLGAGLTARLRGLGAEATAVGSGDGAVLSAALRSCPDVVVLETTDRRCVARVQRLCPRSRVVDVTASMGRGCPSTVVDFDVILDAVWPDRLRG